jgi:two-component system, cell cycle sensor histidine kinase and response regulator CckA
MVSGDLTRDGVLPLLAQLLQFVGVIYALRLYRLFGSRRVGWWLSGVFAFQAALSWIHFSGGESHSPFKVDLLYLALSLMLLAAMVHIERIQNERIRFEQEQLKIQAGLEQMVREKTLELAQRNHELQVELRRQQEYERALSSSEQQYRFLFHESPQPMWVYHRVSLEFLAVNLAARDAYGLTNEKLPNMTLKDLRPAEDIQLFLSDNSVAAPAVEHRGLWRLYRKDGQVAQVHHVVMDITYDGHIARLVLATDMTEKLELERQFRQVQKMEAVGQLAGGVAHDFNNILTVIQGYADLLLRGGKYPQIKDQLRQVLEASRRAAGLTRQLLAFSRRNHLQLAPVDLNDIINNLSKMLRRLIGEDIVLETALSSVPAITGDAGMLEQVLLNLTVNARDAIANGGVISISTSLVELSGDQGRRHHEARDGRFVRLTVRDTGCGMPPEVVAHLFEPFFTTKEVGKGTGLGLATVYGIVKQHSGWVEVETAVGNGTEFRVFLPLADRPATASQDTQHVRKLPSGQGTILIVEDEDPVREFAGLVLESHGYTVIPANSGRAALDIWNRRSADIDLIFTDMVMPGGMSGRDLAEEVRKARPETRVVFTSGHSPSRYGQSQQLLKGLKFLPKPYNPEKLLSAISEAIQAESEPTCVLST